MIDGTMWKDKSIRYVVRSSSNEVRAKYLNGLEFINAPDHARNAVYAINDLERQILTKLLTMTSKDFDKED